MTELLLYLAGDWINIFRKETLGSSVLTSNLSCFVRSQKTHSLRTQGTSIVMDRRIGYAVKQYPRWPLSITSWEDIKKMAKYSNLTSKVFTSLSCSKNHSHSHKNLKTLLVTPVPLTPLTLIRWVEPHLKTRFWLEKNHEKVLGTYTKLKQEKQWKNVSSTAWIMR